jgi:hypothetical protein
MVPMIAQRFQVGSMFESAGARSTIAARLIEAGWWNTLEPVTSLILRWVPDGTHEDLEFWSPEIEVAQSSEK